MELLASISPRIVNQGDQTCFIAIEREKDFREGVIEGDVHVVPGVDFMIVVERRLKLIVEASRARQREIQGAELKLELIRWRGVNQV